MNRFQSISRPALWCGLVFLAFCAGCGSGAPKREKPFILGADVTWILEDEAEGAVYYDKGVKKDPFVILKESGFNYVRARVFVDPARGYSARRAESFGDIPHLLTMARRTKEQGMKLLVDLHFSDGWADPENQNKPAAWRNLSFDQLVVKVREHTRDVVTALKAQGTTPDMIQVGNEITHGMLWPDGRVVSSIPSGNAATDQRMRQAGLEGLGHYDQLATLLKASIEEIHAIDPSIRIAVHNHLGRSVERIDEWMDNLISRGVKFDVVGFSCYAQGKEGDWKKTFDMVARKYPTIDIAVFEYSAQKEYVNDLVFNIPNEQGIGTFIWEPTRHREALFDKNGRNAGGGQASNFVEGFGIDQGATGGPASRPATGPGTRPASGPTSRPGRGLANRPTSGPTSGPASRPRGGRNGGRYDTNEYLKLYPELARKYGLR